ncbi:YbbR family protein [Desulforamulus reducens MI-1]|uniref:YbbR family protein n=1 Tax=Desulforamulus reducens (strain ATCC BAA-1160 / DSM 100696 / MI-1) TaxID=349161 RepID=A4J189_DESRM|nr:CdaR family protein [Desulforamulus reducens]ABO48842.1 YbbR family protein [Desulforamulus reducens MI-1]
MIRLKWSNNTMLLLSLLLAIILWLYVNIVHNPGKEQEFRVALDTRGKVAQGLTISSSLPQEVTVRVQGRNIIQLSGVKAQDFQATVDLNNLQEGVNNRIIQVTAPSGLQVVQVNPARVEITADRVIQRQLPVKVVIKGQPQYGYTTLEPVIEPADVLVRGPARLLKNLTSIALNVDVSGATQNIEQVKSVALPAGLESTPERVKLLLPITRSVPYRMVPVLPRYSGNPEDNYQLVRITVEPSSVKVYAPEEILNNLAGIHTETIQLEGLDKDDIREAKILLPPGVVDIMPGKVEVAIQIKQKQPTTEPSPPKETLPQGKPDTSGEIKQPDTVPE